MDSNYFEYIENISSKFRKYKKYIDVIINNFDGCLIKSPKCVSHIIISIDSDNTEFRFDLNDSDGGQIPDDIQEWFKGKCLEFFKDELFKDSFFLKTLS
jgi:hypothetical protein